MAQEISPRSPIILVVTPLSEERDFLVRSLGAQGCQFTNLSVGKLTVTDVPELALLVAECGHGKSQAALQTQYLCDRLSNIEAVICVGAAGALDEKLSIGDVVLATHTVEHDYTLRFSSRPAPRFEGSPQLLELLHRVKASPSFTVHSVGIASGDEDIIEVVRGQELREATGASAVAWEGAGVARACKFNGIDFVEMRAITDTANHEAASDFETNLQIAMNNIAALLFAWRSGARANTP